MLKIDIEILNKNRICMQTKNTISRSIFFINTNTKDGTIII